MNIERVVFDENSFGNTQRSLKILIDVLVSKFDRAVAVVQVQTTTLCCGFFIFDYEERCAYWTGDGFRTDGGGEGGAGYRSAEAFFSILGLLVYRFRLSLGDPFDGFYIASDWSKNQMVLKIARDVAADLFEFAFSVPRSNSPQYVR